jgi:hypothetical protein
MTLAESALDAVARGLKVHPLYPRTKDHPATAHGSLDASSDVAQVERWWASNPNFNIGCTAGVVLDIDEGLTNIQELRNFLLLNGIPLSLAVRTGGRPGFRCQLHFSGVGPRFHYTANHCSGEVRGAGWYGLWVGSVHPDSGERYELLLDLPVQPWRDEYLREGQIGGSRIGRSRIGRSRIGGEDYEPVDIETARERYGNLLFRAAHALRGSRHHNANTVCYYASRLLLAGGFEQQSFQNVVIFPALTEEEVKRQIWRAVRPLYTRHERNLERMLRDSWSSGLSQGRLALTLYNEDFRVLQSLSNDPKFQNAWDGNCVDFNGAIEARAHMVRVLTAAGCTDIDRVLKSSRIDALVAFQLEFERSLK